MELKILDKKERLLLSRTEIKAQAAYTEAVPSKESIKKSLASQLKADEKLIVVKHIFPKFKIGIADVLAYHYISEEDMKKIEKEKKKKGKKPEDGKEAPKEDKKPEEKPKEEPKEEKPAEAPKEDK